MPLEEKCNEQAIKSALYGSALTSSTIPAHSFFWGMSACMHVPLFHCLSSSKRQAAIRGGDVLQMIPIVQRNKEMCRVFLPGVAAVKYRVTDSCLLLYALRGLVNVQGGGEIIPLEATINIYLLAIAAF